ncbi:MAG TPA: hypothetical protein GX692_04715 [Acholeplasmataceae bacterium]|jgi:hypothetical protein|nr:hypothetical protein [Acholeplasmataceae bacterium]
MKKLFILAFKNLKSYLRYNLKLIITTSCLVFLVSLFSAYVISLSNKQKEMKFENISSGYLLSFSEMDFSKSEITSTKAIFKQFDFSKISEDYFGYAFDYLTAFNVVIEHNSKYYQDSDFDLEISFYSGDAESIFTQNDYQELKLKFGLDEFLIGSLPKNKSEILVSEKFLKSFGLSFDLIGQKISIAARNDKNKYIFENLKISGVIREEYHMLSGHESHFSFTPTVFMLEDNNLFTENSENIRTVFRYTFDKLLSKKETLLLEGEDYFYVGKFTVSTITDINTIQVLTKRLFSIIGIALFIGIILTLYLLITKYIKIFSRSSGILLTCGISIKDLYRLLYLQLLLLSFFSLIISFILTISGFLGINELILRLFYLELGLSAALILKIFIISMLFVIIIATMFYLYIFRKIRRNTIREFLITQVL